MTEQLTAKLMSALLLVAAASRVGTAEPAGRLVGENVQQFFVEPNRPAEIVFAASAVEQTPAYTVVDYRERLVTRGHANATASGKQSIRLTLPMGYYEVRFASGDVFGVVSAPAFDRPAEPFFGIDAALSWLEQDARARVGMIAVLKRSGVAFARERMGMANVNPAAGKFDFQTKRNFDAVRKEYAKQGIAVLDMFDTPGPHFRSAGTLKNIRYGDELGPIAAAWQPIVRQYGATWDSLEVSNEPELTPWPADQYVPTVKTAAYAQQQAGSRVPLVGGVFGGNAPGPFHDVCAASGMLDVVDAVSFHTYDSAATLGTLVGQYRKWMAASGKEAMPLWLTEAGRPWTLGPPRAPFDEDTACAAATAALVIESRANGLARVCPFVLPYYEEGGLKSFSMLGRDRSPMRAMGAYVNSIRLLAGKAYLGDLAADSGPALVRVFGDERSQLITVFLPNASADSTVKLNVPVTRVEGIDGRALKPNADGSVPVPDGIAYVWADRAAVAEALRTDTETARLYKIGQRQLAPRGRASAIVLQHPLAGEKGKMSPRRYLLTEADAKALPLRVRVDNLGPTPRQVTLTPKLPGDTAQQVGPKTVDVPAGGHAVAEWTIDAGRALDAAELRLITVEGTTSDGEAVLPLAIPYQTEGTLADHLARNGYRVKLPVGDLKRWQPNVVGHGKLEMSAGDGVFRFDASYTKPGERWAYPRFVLREPIDAQRARGVVVRAKIARPGSNIALMAFQAGKPGFWAMEVMPADGQWHVFYVPFTDLQAMPGNPDMQNAIVRPDRFTALQLGMKSQDATNSMEISDVYIVGP